jgi:RNA polymerase sigma factor (TIGR02999 family)
MIRAPLAGLISALPLISPLVSLDLMNEVTRILSAIEQGDPHAAGQLLPLVYEQLRRLAVAKIAHETPGQTLEATALVHEAYVRLVDVDKAQYWNSQGHFFAAAAEAMRRILIENARRKCSLKHGGKRQEVDLNAVASLSKRPPHDLLALDEALTRLHKEDPVVRTARAIHVGQTGEWDRAFMERRVIKVTKALGRRQPVAPLLSLIPQ